MKNGKNGPTQQRRDANPHALDAFTDILANRIHGLGRENYQFLEVKQLAEILVRYREKAREAVREMRSWKARVSVEKDDIEKLYLNYEGMFLKDHVRDTLRLYRMVSRDFYDVYGTYMGSIGKSAAMLRDGPAMTSGGKRHAA